MARYKGQREIKITLAFCVAKNSSHNETSHPARGKYDRRPLREKKISPFIHAAKPSGHIEASQPARG